MLFPGECGTFAAAGLAFICEGRGLGKTLTEKSE